MPNKHRQQHHVHEIQHYDDLFEHHNVMPVKKAAHSQKINLSLILNTIEAKNFCLRCKPTRLRHEIFARDEYFQPYQLSWIQGKILSRVSHKFNYFKKGKNHTTFTTTGTTLGRLVGRSNPLLASSANAKQPPCHDPSP